MIPTTVPPSCRVSCWPCGRSVGTRGSPWGSRTSSACDGPRARPSRVTATTARPGSPSTELLLHPVSGEGNPGERGSDIAGPPGECPQRPSVGPHATPLPYDRGTATPSALSQVLRDRGDHLRQGPCT